MWVHRITAFVCSSFLTGKVFRSWYGEVCQLQSLLPTEVPFIALTATVTTQLCRIITDQLQMEKVAVVTHHQTE